MRMHTATDLDSIIDTGKRAPSQLWSAFPSPGIANDCKFGQIREDNKIDPWGVADTRITEKTSIVNHRREELHKMVSDTIR